MSKKKNNKKRAIRSEQPKAKVRSANKAMRKYLGLILLILGFALYANTLGHDYALDDYSAIKSNWVTQKGIAGLPTIFTTNYRHGYWQSKGELYRPIPLSLFALEWQIAPDNPGFYHFVNVLLYAISGFVLFWVLAEVLSAYHILLPFLATAFFMAHPSHPEIVANIKSADEMLAFLFSLGAIHYLWQYLKNKQMSSLVFSLGMYTLALFSKESVITFLAIFPLIVYFFRPKSFKTAAPKLALYLLPVILYFSARVAVLGDFSSGVGSASVLDNLLNGADSWISQKATAFVLLGKYLWTLAVGYPLSSDYGYNEIPLVGLGDWKALLSIAIYGGIFAYAVLKLKERHILSFGILFFLLTFSIFSNIFVLIGSSYGERFLYIPSLGYCIALAALFLMISNIGLKDRSPDNFGAVLKSLIPGFAVALVVLLLYSASTIMRNPDWKDSYTLYAADVQKAPGSSKLQYHFGLETMKRAILLKDNSAKAEGLNKAIHAFNTAISIYPKYHDAYGELGLAYFRLGDPAKALSQYEKSIEYKPNNPTVYSNMGIIYFQQNNMSKAQEVYEKAVSLDPAFVDARRNLGSVYARTRQFDKAIEQFSEGLKYDPNNATLNFYLGSSYRDKGDAAKAKQYLDRAYQLDPSLKQ